jgi:DNA-binding transcriptional regulator YiaG
MKTIQEMGQAVAVLRKELGLKQGVVAAQAGIALDTLSRFERGVLPEFGSRKLLAVLAVLGAKISFTKVGASGTLDTE